MRMWSAGLGSEDTALVLDFTKAKFTWEGGKVFINGTVVAPVNWEYKLILTKEDVPGLLWIILSIPTLRYFARNITGAFVFIRDKFILRRMGKETSESEASETPAS